MSGPASGDNPAPPAGGEKPSSPSGDGPSGGGPSDRSAKTRSDEPKLAGVTEDGSKDSTPAARVIRTEKPQTMDAPKEDLQVAMSAKAVEAEPLPAKKEDVAEFSSALRLTGPKPGDKDGQGPRDGSHDNSHDNNGAQPQSHHDDHDFSNDRDRPVKQWDPNWVRYDEYYRPVICNPYHQPVKIVYIYQNQPRIVYINPLEQVVLNVAQYAAYSFTAVVANAASQAINVAIGSFFGGGYYPGYGLPLPPPPPPVLAYNNVPVQVRYSQDVYEPFRVNRVVDAGFDSQYGEQKVLLDGVTPAWGTWNQSPSGERQFEIHKTQQFPGLDEPAEGPLPGDYQLHLASDDKPAGTDPKTIYMVVVAGILAALSLGAVLWSTMLGRRRTLR